MRFFTGVYLLLLIYIITALCFWEFNLQKQSAKIYEQSIQLLKSEVDSAKNPSLYLTNKNVIEGSRKSRTSQYIGEGATFLIVILIGAAVVYGSFRRRILMSKQQNNFILSVTHELKTPIAAIKLNVQTLEKHKLSEEKKLHILAQCINQANRLNDLCNNMLFAARIEGRQFRPAKEIFNISKLAEDCYHEYKLRFQDRLLNEIVEDCMFAGDKMTLQIAINNLLENAVKYSPQHTPIIVRLSSNTDKIKISIIDEGVGIADSEKKKVFKKFYRIGNEETRKTKGTGLGLYLTGKIIQQHKGTLTIKDNIPKGSIFEIVLPKND